VTLKDREPRYKKSVGRKASRDHKEEVALQVQEDQMVSKENLEKVVS